MKSWSWASVGLALAVSQAGFPESAGQIARPVTTAYGTATLASPANAASTAVIPAPAGKETPAAARITERGFPSVFGPWQFGSSRPDPGSIRGDTPDTDPRLAQIARHDLYWNTWNALGLRLPDGDMYPLLTPVFTPESIKAALTRRAALLAANPNIIIMSEIEYRAARPSYLPPDSPYWLRDQKFEQFGNGRRYGRRRLNIADTGLQDKAVAFCVALISTGVYDGCMLDLWHEDTSDTARDSLSFIRKLRAAVGDNAILIANVNGRLPIYTAPYLNGMYMEGFGAPYFPDWRTAAANLSWGESHLHKPAITALEGWWQTTGRSDLPLMRQVTTLSLVFSNGYVLFGDPNGPPDHLHDWYPFWGKSLGQPREPVAELDHPNSSGAYMRRFEHGDVVFNPPENKPAIFTFPYARRSAATGVIGLTFTVGPGDGDLFLIPQESGAVAVTDRGQHQ